MDVKSYLLELIASQKIIGINYFGTLFKKKIPGRYDSETHSFLPPKYEVHFSTELREDETLANFISEKQNIAVESANYHINNFVEEIQAQLNDHQQADFSPFGELKRIDYQIVFEPSKTFEINFDFYGLPSVASPVDENLILVEDTETKEGIAFEEKLEDVELEEKVEDAELEEKAENVEAEEKLEDVELEEKVEYTEPRPEQEQDEQPIFDEIDDVNNIQALNEIEERVDVEQNDDKETVQFGITDPLWKPTVIHRYEYNEDDDDENTGRGKRIFLKTLLILFIIAAAGAVAYFFYPDFFNNVNNNSIESVSIPAVDTISNTPFDSTTTDSVKKTPELTTAFKDSLTYEVIGSAMKTQRKVDEVILTLSRRGISAKKMEAMPGKLIKISLGTFTNFKLAKKFQDSLKIKLKNPEIYIQTIKPKN